MTETPKNMDEHYVEFIARRSAELVVEQLIQLGAVTPRPPAVLTLEEAMELARKGSVDAFYRWNAAFGPTACGHGRYSRDRVERALAREARR